MKRFFLILILIINIQSWGKANDIKDYTIEGMSLEESLLNHFSEDQILNNVVDWYDDLEKNRYLSMAFGGPDFESYEYVDVWTKHGDKKYIIEGIAGSIYFGEDKDIKDINHCYDRQKEIAKEFENIFDSSVKDGPHKMNHTADPSGKSSYTDIYFEVGKKYFITLSCYDWSDSMLKSENKADHFSIFFRSYALSDWLS
tara:strand:+ start:304 stop:900 length:597 start_codon:yes stop_codon:yes gene_type:complete